MSTISKNSESNKEAISSLLFSAILFIFVGILSFIALKITRAFLFEKDSHLSTSIIGSLIGLALLFLLSRIHTDYFINQIKKRNLYSVLIVAAIFNVLLFIFENEDTTSMWFIYGVVLMFMCLYGYITKIHVYSIGSLMLMASVGAITFVILGSLLNYSDMILNSSTVIALVIPLYIGIDHSNKKNLSNN